jgi:hypothetical protein
MIEFQGTSTDPARGTPLWWVRRLSAGLNNRRVLLNQWEDYYTGKLNLALASEKWRKEFASRFPEWTTNFMALVVDKHRERLAVQGIRYGVDEEADDDSWEWWQRQHMDAEAVKLHRESLVKGISYALLWPEGDDVGVSVESPLEVIVETEPGRAWRRRAALKRFMDEDGYARAELYLPDAVYKYRSSQRDIEFSVGDWFDRANIVAWQPYAAPEDLGRWPLRNIAGVVPVVPFVNRPDLKGNGESEIAPVASSQDAINKYRVDAFIASEFASFRQRWAIGLDIPIDPVTGAPIEPFKAAVDRLWVVPPPDVDDFPDARQAPEVKFGEFDVTPLEPFYAAIRGEIQMLGAISRTPYHYLLPQTGQPPSGESLRSAEAGLVAKVADTHTSFGEAHEELFRLRYRFLGDERSNRMDAEVIWKDPETQNFSALADALGKMAVNLGVPREALWERIPGVTPQTIKRWRRMALEQAIEDALRAPAPGAPGGPPAAGGPPAESEPADEGGE